MIGALTAADTNEDDIFSEEVEQTPSGYEVGVSEGVVADLTPVYDQAIARLREQRRGLSARERLGALLIGFGQPTRHGKWQEGAANAAQLLFQQSVGRRKEDEDRRRELDRLMNAREVAKIRSNAAIEAAKIRAGAKGDGAASAIVSALGRKPNADEVKRIGYAQRLWPNVDPKDLVTMLYHPKVEVYMMRPGIASAAASQGMDPGAAIGSVEGAVGDPTLSEFLAEARVVNPGVSDAELTAYYKREYGGR